MTEQSETEYIYRIFIHRELKDLLDGYILNTNKEIEQCAMLLGKGNKVLDIIFTENIDKSSVHFTISDKQLIETYQIAEEKQMDVIGIFHTHPFNVAWPSSTDKKYMKTNPVVWIIYSGINKNLKAFILKGEEPLVVEIPIEESSK